MPDTKKIDPKATTQQTAPAQPQGPATKVTTATSPAPSGAPQPAQVQQPVPTQVKPTPVGVPQAGHISGQPQTGQAPVGQIPPQNSALPGKSPSTPTAVAGAQPAGPLAPAGASGPHKGGADANDIPLPNLPGAHPAAQSLTPEELEAALRHQQGQQNMMSGSPLPNASDIEFSPPLVQSLVDLARLHGMAISARHLSASLPKVEGAIHPSACIRAAREAGLQVNTVHRPTLAKISNFALPCILLLKENQSCVLEQIDSEKAICIFPENSIKREVPTAELETSYLGYAIFAKPEAKLDARTSKIKLVEKKQWFWGTLAYFLPIYKHVIGASIVVNLLAICGPLFFMTVYDRVVPNNATDTLWMLASGIIVAYIFDFLLRNLRGYFTDIAGRNADVIIASRLMEQVLAMRLDAKPDSTGSLANNLREFESLRDFFGSTTLMTLVDLPFLIFFVAIIFLVGGPLGVIPLIAVPIVVCVGLFLQRPLQDVAEKGFKENMQKNALLYEIVSGLEAIKATMAEGRIQHAWENVVGLSAASNARSKRMANLSMTFTMIITQLVSISIIIWGVYLIKEGELSMGGLIASNMLSGRAMAPLSQVASMLTRFQQSRMALLSLDQIMNLETEKPDGDQYIEFGHLEQTLALDEVSFKYPESERYALEKVSVTIYPGEKVGIIGRMGSGKTTFGRLCVGFYRPTEGAVKFGGVDIRQMDTITLRSRVGYVAQDNYLFYGTVRENISFGALDADDRMILRASNIAGVTEFVRNHPAGFGMPVGERGMSLSGGQRQSVAIARALLHDPDVLILDEPSSNMDNAAEFALRERLKTSLGDEKTLILITHRLSMLALIDRLIVVDNGKVFADGPRDQVLKAITNRK